VYQELKRSEETRNIKRHEQVSGFYLPLFTRGTRVVSTASVIALDLPAMADFLGGTNDLDDFDRAASAFPDISLDGSSDIPSTVPLPAKKPSTGFSFDDFETEPITTNVRVTGDDEIEKFESSFPELDVSPVPAPAIQVTLGVLL
jgi:hypothetical protein